MILKNSKFQLFIGIILSIVFLAIAWKPVKFDDLLTALATFNWVWCIPYLLVSWLGFYFRAIRWKYLLFPTKSFSANRLFSPLVAGFGLNNIFPARLGEFARAYILHRKDGVPFMTGMGTVVIERLFDMLILLALLPIALASTNIPADFSLTYGQFTITGALLTQLSKQLAVLCSLIFFASVLLLIPAFRSLIETILRMFPFLPTKFVDFSQKLLHSFAEGLSSLKTPKAWFAVTVYSALVWLCCAWSFQILSYGFPGINMSFLQGTAVMVITCIAIIVPAAPGFWGLFELGVMFGLLILNIVPDNDFGKASSLAYAFINHFLVYATIIPAGLYCLYREKITLSDVASAKPKESE